MKGFVIGLVMVGLMALSGCGPAEPEGYMAGDESPAALEAAKKDSETGKSAEEKKEEPDVKAAEVGVPGDGAGADGGEETQKEADTGGE